MNQEDSKQDEVDRMKNVSSREKIAFCIFLFVRDVSAL